MSRFSLNKIIGVGLFMILLLSAQVCHAQFIENWWELVDDTYLSPLEDYNVGASSDRIANGYFANLDTNTIIINTASEGALIIDVTDTEAFLVRRNSDAGDLFIVDTTNFNIEFLGGTTFSPTTVTSTAVTIDQNYNHKSLVIDSEATSVNLIEADGQNTSGNLLQLSVGGSNKFIVDYTGATTVTTLNTGQGAYELFAMDQNVLTSSSPTFANLIVTTNVTTSTLNATSGITVDGASVYYSGGTDVAVADGGTNSSTALNNDFVMVSSGGAIIESASITVTELGLLNGLTGALYEVGGTDVAVTDGGTGKSSWTQYSMSYASSTTELAEIAIGLAGEILTVNTGANGYEWTSAGTGDVLSVGDCASGACLDGTSDGGTYIRLYDGDSDYVQLSPGNYTTSTTITLPGGAGTLARTIDNVATATALAANGSNCNAGQAPLGVDASGAVESCFAVYYPGGGDVAVADGGTGASTLTGLLQGNGTSAFTVVTDSSTVGQVLRVTGAAAYAWGALDLGDSDAVTGLLPVASGGTNNAYFTVSGPATSAKTYTFPNSSVTIAYAGGAFHDGFSDFAAGEHFIQANIVATGALNSGSITSGFGNIDTGSSTLGCGVITSTGIVKATTGLWAERASDTATTKPYLLFRRSRDGAPTLDVSDNDTIGELNFTAYHTDGYDIGAKIIAEVDDTPGNGDMPSRIVLLTSPDGAATPVEALRIDSSQDAAFAGAITATSYDGVLAANVLDKSVSEIIEDNWTWREAADNIILFAEDYSTDNTDRSVLIFRKSDHNTPGERAETADDEQLGEIQFSGVDANDSFDTPVIIRAEQNAVAAASNIGADLLFETKTSGDTTVITRLKILDDGGVLMYDLKAGINQGIAGAAINELWVDTDDDNTIKLGT